MRYLALCCIVKDEDLFLPEWLAYHTLLGVEHFYVYDNGSATPVAELLRGKADSGLVTVTRLQEGQGQIPAYLDCLARFGSQCRWLGFLDLDEFVHCKQDTDLRVLLAEFEAYGALSLNWKIFSSGGHLSRPSLPVIAAYRQVFCQAREDELHVKSFVQPARTRGLSTPHNFIYRQGFHAVTDEHFPIPGQSPLAHSSRPLAEINHYFFRSQQDFEEKLRKGRPDAKRSQSTRSLNEFYLQADEAGKLDSGITARLPELLRLLAGPDPLTSPAPAPPADGMSWLDLAADALGREKYTEAQVFLCHGTMHGADPQVVALIRGMAARLQGRFERAERFLRQALRLGPCPDAHLELARLHKDQGCLADAVSLAKLVRAELVLSDQLSPAWEERLQHFEDGLQQQN